MKAGKSFPFGTTAIFAVFILILILTVSFLSPHSNPVPKNLAPILQRNAIPIRPFSLTSHDGLLYTEQQIKGKWSFLYFGDTHCPDICPATLSSLAKLLYELGKVPQTVPLPQVLFVSMDPDQDSPAILADYVKRYSSNLTGLTGFRSSLQQMALQFGISHPESAPGDLPVAHDSPVFLLDPQIRIVAVFRPPLDIAVMANQYREILRLYSPK